ncbi:glycine-rich domain-containing protein [Pseudoalteromonas sp. S16_S37]|uniref:glycine-rich domain-containing protein n=1 Tax=Pseudoalteromonas sp. S16_S37 TaxID=2720228 RepID=UPI0016800630|nr:hypothetical protein [Pseudoalteromonas sp. S16_S37]MBD1582805.1 hypothetical protein [Pseudoalteromonas sp. S16_S37]
MSTSVSDLNQNNYLNAYPAVQGQILVPNRRYAFSHDILSVRLPPIDTLKVGDWIELVPAISWTHSVQVQIIDNARLISSVSPIAHDKNNPLIVNGQYNNYSGGYGGAIYHRYRFNGRDWQPEQKWSAAQAGLSNTSGVEVITASKTFTVPAGVTELIIDAVAAGGGAGGGATKVHDPSPDAPQHTASGGGGAGGGAAVVNARVPVVSGQEIQIIIGDAGIGGFTYLLDPPVDKNGTNGTDAGITKVGDFIEIEGGKGGNGGTFKVNDGSGATIAPAIGGMGGMVLVNNTNGQAFNGGRGGASGTAAPNSSTSGENGASIGYTGGDGAPVGIPISNSGGGGGGASAFGDGGGSGLNGSNFGGGGGADSGYVYSSTSSTSGLYAGNGGRSMVKIQWEVQ